MPHTHDPANSAMPSAGYRCYVGRVGALAVALGIGVAMPANWEWTRVDYTSAGVAQTDQVWKTSQNGPQTDGVLNAVNNRTITVALPSSQSFNVTWKNNGNSTSTVYVIPAI